MYLSLSLCSMLKVQLQHVKLHRYMSWVDKARTRRGMRMHDVSVLATEYTRMCCMCM